MKVALFTETFLPKVDGVVTIITQMIERMQFHGITPIIIAPPTAPTTYNGIPVFPSWGTRFLLYPELHFSFPSPQGIKAIIDFQPDIIHVMNPTFIGVVGTIMATIGKVPLVGSVHMDIDTYVTQYAGAWGLPIAWAYFRLWHNRAHLNLAPSTATLQQITSHGIQRGRHWQRGIDLTRFRQMPRNDSMRIRLSNNHPDDLLVLYVGRLSKEKGVQQLRDLCELPGVRVALVGGGPQELETKRYFANSNAHFAGILTGSALIDAYNAADIFVFPSQSETFGLAPLEAMACGLPVIAPFVGGLRDTVQAGYNALIYDPAKPQSLIDAVTTLRDNHSMRQQLSQQAHAYAQQKSWQSSMDQLIDIYRALYTQRNSTHK
jgi:glycosyltransferase involved in cell wall biosynthesis